MSTTTDTRSRLQPRPYPPERRFRHRIKEKYRQSVGNDPLLMKMPALIGAFALLCLLVAVGMFFLFGCTANVETGKVTVYPTNWNNDGSQADLEFSNTTSETVEVFWEIWDPYFDESSSGSTVVSPPAVGSRESTACLDDYRFNLTDTIGCTVYLPTPSGIETITVDEPRKMKMPRAPGTGRTELVLAR